MDAQVALTIPTILVRLIGAGVVGALIGYERRMHHKSIGIAHSSAIILISNKCSFWGVQWRFVCY